VLVESGSNDNRFVRNDCTHGGDGVFIRVLNGWVSTGNVFEENDCSYANNNCFEAWSPRNTYVRNKANHGSYGFWLGASDQTVLDGNEASHNGDPKGFHNSPHLPKSGHAGIVFMFGPSSHTIARGNICEGNNGAGIAVIGDLDSKGRRWKAFHWILEQNKLRDNRWGVFLQHADWIDMAGNTFEKNAEGDVHQEENVTNLSVRPDKADVIRPPKAKLVGPSSGIVGREVVFDASQSTDPAGLPLAWRWDLGDGTIAKEAKVRHVFNRPGFHRVGMTVNNGVLSDLAWRDFYVVEDGPEGGTEGAAAEWTWSDPQSKVTFADDRQQKIAGGCSVRASISPYGGGLVELVYPAQRKAGLSLSGKNTLVLWIRAVNEGTPAWQGDNPVVTLHGPNGKRAVLTAGDLLSNRPNNEEREGWTYLAIPLRGSKEWKCTGDVPETLEAISLGFDSWGAPPLSIWIDGMAIR
jgi:parallel beta-helix repeat protein